jgi:hypothetical protein
LINTYLSRREGRHKHSGCSEIVVTLALRKLHIGSILELLVHVLDLILIDGDLRGLQDGGLNKGEVRVTI